MVEYKHQVGESLMGAFTRAFSMFADTIPFTHSLLDEHLDELRALMLPKVPPPDVGAYRYFGVSGSSIYHDAHKGIRRDLEWHHPPADRRGCKVCKP